MSDFNKYLNSLPQPLDKKEQEFLFYEFSKTRDESIRQKLIERNLRLAAKFAYQYCTINNKLSVIEDVNSDCVIALVRAIDDYDVSKGIEFSTLAMKYMSTITFSRLRKSSDDALSVSEDFEFFNEKELEEEKEGFLNFLFDETESHIPEDVAGEEFIKSVLDFIDSLDNENMRLAIKMTCGLDGFDKLNQNQIAELRNIKRTYVSYLLNRGRFLIKEFIFNKFPEYYPIIGEEMPVNLKFESDEEMNEYIINHYFGIGCKKEKLQDIANQVRKNKDVVYYIIENFLNSLSEEEKEKYKTLRSKENPNTKTKWTEDRFFEFYNAYFGLNGNKVHTVDELLVLYDIKNKGVLSARVSEVTKKYIREGLYTREQIDELKKNRNIVLNGTAEKYAYEYNSYYGLKGCEKKSKQALAKELKVTVGTIGNHIKIYQEYLDNSNQQEKEQN